MILKADISKTSPGRHLFIFIFMCGNSKRSRIQKIKNTSGDVNWVNQALKIVLYETTKSHCSESAHQLTSNVTEIDVSHGVRRGKVVLILERRNKYL